MLVHRDAVAFALQEHAANMRSGEIPDAGAVDAILHTAEALHGSRVWCESLGEWGPTIFVLMLQRLVDDALFACSASRALHHTTQTPTLFAPMQVTTTQHFATRHFPTTPQRKRKKDGSSTTTTVSTELEMAVHAAMDLLSYPLSTATATTGIVVGATTSSSTAMVPTRTANALRQHLSRSVCAAHVARVFAYQATTANVLERAAIVSLSSSSSSSRSGGNSGGGAGPGLSFNHRRGRMNRPGTSPWELACMHRVWVPHVAPVLRTFMRRELDQRTVTQRKSATTAARPTTHHHHYRHAVQSSTYWPHASRLLGDTVWVHNTRLRIEEPETAAEESLATGHVITASTIRQRQSGPEHVESFVACLAFVVRVLGDCCRRPAPASVADQVAVEETLFPLIVMMADQENKMQQRQQPEKKVGVVDYGYGRWTLGLLGIAGDHVGKEFSRACALLFGPLPTEDDTMMAMNGTASDIISTCMDMVTVTAPSTAASSSSSFFLQQEEEEEEDHKKKKKIKKDAHHVVWSTLHTGILAGIVRCHIAAQQKRRPKMMNMQKKIRRALHVWADTMLPNALLRAVHAAQQDAIVFRDHHHHRQQSLLMVEHGGVSTASSSSSSSFASLSVWGSDWRPHKIPPTPTTTTTTTQHHPSPRVASPELTMWARRTAFRVMLAIDFPLPIPRSLQLVPLPPSVSSTMSQNMVQAVLSGKRSSEQIAADFGGASQYLRRARAQHGHAFGDHMFWRLFALQDQVGRIALTTTSTTTTITQEEEDEEKEVVMAGDVRLGGGVDIRPQVIQWPPPAPWCISATKEDKEKGGEEEEEEEVEEEEDDDKGREGGKMHPWSSSSSLSEDLMRRKRDAAIMENAQWRMLFQAHIPASMLTLAPPRDSLLPQASIAELIATERSIALASLQQQRARKEQYKQLRKQEGMDVDDDEDDADDDEDDDEAKVMHDALGSYNANAAPVLASIAIADAAAERVLPQFVWLVRRRILDERMHERYDAAHRAVLDNPTTAIHLPLSLYDHNLRRDSTTTTTTTTAATTTTTATTATTTRTFEHLHWVEYTSFVGGAQHVLSLAIQVVAALLQWKDVAGVLPAQASIARHEVRYFLFSGESRKHGGGGKEEEEEEEDGGGGGGGSALVYVVGGVRRGGDSDARGSGGSSRCVSSETVRFCVPLFPLPYTSSTSIGGDGNSGGGSGDGDGDGRALLHGHVVLSCIDGGMSKCNESGEKNRERGRGGRGRGREKRKEKVSEKDEKEAEDQHLVYAHEYCLVVKLIDECLALLRDVASTRGGGGGNSRSSGGGGAKERKKTGMMMMETAPAVTRSIALFREMVTGHRSCAQLLQALPQIPALVWRETPLSEVGGSDGYDDTTNEKDKNTASPRRHLVVEFRGLHQTCPDLFHQTLINCVARDDSRPSPSPPPPTSSSPLQQLFVFLCVLHETAYPAT